jgi:hypothetical protein
MPLHESNRSTRDRWPLEFDLEGVPRNTKERERLLRERANPQENDMPYPNPTVNHFAVDTVPNVVDINNPPKIRVPYMEFPKMMYHHDSGKVLTVADQKQEKAAFKHGFQLQPSPTHDYSNIKHGVAGVKAVGEPRVTHLTAEQLAALEEEDQ